MTKALVLVSGGIDSAVVLAKALNEGKEVHALSFDYGQRHRCELTCATQLCTHYGVEQTVLPLTTTAFKHSALVTGGHREASAIVPSTYVPARNTLFLANAAAIAETIGAHEIHFGPNKDDQLPYPDRRPIFIEAFQGLLNIATQSAIEGNAPKLCTPLLDLTKAEIVALGHKLGVPFHLTWTCYAPAGDVACGKCLSCTVRLEAFQLNGFTDPARY